MNQSKFPKTIGVGLIGLGTVGTGVYQILQKQAAALEKKHGFRLALRKVCVKTLSKKRKLSLSKRLLTNRPEELLADPSIDIVVELIGGIHPAQEIIQKALRVGKQVVTANKALLAERGDSLFRQASLFSKEIGIEASVCGGIPIIRSFKEGLASNNITGFLGIVNGTCNYILTAMSQKGSPFAVALNEAKAKGYAEKDPTLDISGADSAHKLAILARLAFGANIPFKKISIEGIQSVTAEDIAYAKELGYGIKLLAIGKKLSRGLELRVHPTLLPFDHPLCSVRGVYNAVFIHSDQAGDLLFYGRGAGQWPTASAVMSDIIDIAQGIARGKAPASARDEKLPSAAVLPLEETMSKYYLRFQVVDRPGVLGRIAQTLGKNHISILSVHQKESHHSRSVPVIILTYEASEKNIRRALKVIDAMGAVNEATVVLRAEN